MDIQELIEKLKDNANNSGSSRKTKPISLLELTGILNSLSQNSSTIEKEKQIVFPGYLIESVTKYLLGVKNKSTDVEAEQLRAFGYLIFENASKLSPLVGFFCYFLIEKLIQQCVQFLTPLSSPSFTNKEVQRLAINCIGNLCAKSGNSMKSYILNIYDLLFSNFELYNTQVIDNISVSKLLSSTLRALQYVILEGKNLHESNIKSFATALKKLCFFGTQIFPANTKEMKRRGSKDFSFTETEIIASTSDSEHSDNENQSVTDRYQTWKVRLHALTCVSAIAKVTPKAFYGHWSLFIPSSPHSLTPSIFTVILHDPSPKVRSVASSTLTIIIDGSKNYLLAANESAKTKTGSFTPFSQTLGSMIREIHNGLSAALDSETNTAALNQILKSTSALIANAPYERLSPGLLTGIVSRLNNFALSVDINVRVTALSCLATALNTKSPQNEISSLLVSNSILQQLIDELGSKSNLPSSIKSEILQIFGSISHTYFEVARKHWILLFPLVLQSLSDGDDSIRYSACKVIEEYTNTCAEKESSLNNALLWESILEDKRVINCYKDHYHNVRASVCSSLANITEETFSQLSNELQKKSINLIIQMISDNSPLVRTNACRALGVVILFPQSYNDISFVSETLRVLFMSMGDNNLNVRIRACWSLGNLCDALAKSTSFAVNIQMFKKLVDVCIKATKDNDKVRSNAVRALGNVSRIASQQHLETDSILERIVESLIFSLNGGSVKVQWNASYAIGNLFRNSYVQRKLDSFSLSTKLFGTLTSIIRECKNFKARINATLALSLLPMRIHYPGSTFNQVFLALVEAIETIDNMSDFSEYKYQENLRLQIIITLTHIINLSSADDFNNLQSILSSKSEMIYSQFEKYKSQAQEIIKEDISSAMAKLLPYCNSKSNS